MIIDFHIHTGESLFHHNFPLEMLFQQMEELNIDRAVLHPFKPVDYHFEPENTKVAELVRQYPGKFHAFGRVDPWRGDAAIDEIHRIFDRLNLSGLFLHPLEEQFPLTSPILKPIMELVGEYKKPVMLSGGHVRVSHPRQIEFLAKEYPHITFLATSGGQINISGLLMADAEDMLADCPNVMVETSGIYRRDFIEQMTDKLGAERVIFGSGTPYFHQALELERIKTAEIGAEDREKIWCGNALRLLG